MEIAFFGIWSLKLGISAGVLVLELHVSVLSHRWTVSLGFTALSVFVRTFSAFGTSTANWSQNEKLHSTMTVNARTN
jgi:hypothetical protein